MKSGIKLIAEERQEQLTKHKRSVQDDRKYNQNGVLAKAAIAIIDGTMVGYPDSWDFDVKVAINAKDYKHRLIIAGALIAAELDRINEKK